jgi:hypothetical protein
MLMFVTLLHYASLDYIIVGLFYYNQKLLILLHNKYKSPLQLELAIFVKGCSARCPVLYITPLQVRKLLLRKPWIERLQSVSSDPLIYDHWVQRYEYF